MIQSGHGMMAEVKLLSSSYLRLQGDRCQRMSRQCMDLGTARDLRFMAEEYFTEASAMEAEAGEPIRH